MFVETVHNRIHSKTDTTIIPGNLSVIRRNGTLASFDSGRINAAITKAFWDVEGTSSATSGRITEIVNFLTQEIVNVLIKRAPINGGTIHIEDIQDQVELALMRNEHHQVARSYVLYREERRKIRDASLARTQEGVASDLNIILDDGNTMPLDISMIEESVKDACLRFERSQS